MAEIFPNLNVLEILRLGLAGLCFLLSLLAFWLIHSEQQREATPRKGILKAIYTFMGVNVATAVLVAMAGYLGPRPQGKASDGLSASTYLIDYSTFYLDLTQWTPSTLGPVAMKRADYVRKVSEKDEDYVLPFFTTGQSVICRPISYSSQPIIVGPKRDPERAGLHYDYRLPIGHQPAGHSELVSSEFTYSTGFHDPEHEWWQASVAYPSKTVSVLIRFPADKPCKNISVSDIAGIKGKQLITDNMPSVSDNGHIITWVGINIDANHRIQFDWDW
jgi:hypothetical protein